MLPCKFIPAESVLQGCVKHCRRVHRNCATCTISPALLLSDYHLAGALTVTLGCANGVSWCVRQVPLSAALNGRRVPRAVRMPMLATMAGAQGLEPPHPAVSRAAGALVADAAAQRVRCWQRPPVATAQRGVPCLRVRRMSAAGAPVIRSDGICDTPLLAPVRPTFFRSADRVPPRAGQTDS